ncbi:unnamed protein product [Chondrus crispus]|uniref:Uncharacterized protein n=1 Tax=Chondrus crispus TaxID=2769 RepID=R7QRF6_CHOCR|nr:unnamed protein product [Chondrus crispus]CDF40061.1 unnamed protein product [Chondrus crispus]|eukprot:XP_005710355.1 unnamed protein product [Chondrus crispus]
MCAVKTQILFIIRFVKQICVQICAVETKLKPEGDPTAPCPKSQKADSCPPVIGSTIF